MQTIRHSDTCDAVLAARYLIGAGGLDKGRIFDAAMVAYVCAWQRLHGCEPDGVIGPETWRAIAAEQLVCSTARNRVGTHVIGLQIALGGLNADGIYGSKTKNAVAAYQSASGLSVDGICGPKTWAALLGGGALSSPAATLPHCGGEAMDGRVINACCHYLQWDPRWKGVRYSTHTSSQTIGNSGCGPTAMAMIVATWIDIGVTPVEMAELAMELGCRTYNSGTSWDYFPRVFERYGFGRYVATGSVSVLLAAIREGALAVCSMNSNDDAFWTRGGHFIVARGCDDEYVYANDPNKSECPRKQAISRFASCMKQAFVYWPREETEGDGGALSSPSATLPHCKVALSNFQFAKASLANGQTEDFQIKDLKTSPRGEAGGNAGKLIVDISKWDGTIDFGKLAPAVSLVIARAACGSDPDPRFEAYANELRDRGIPLGVYGYSYAADGIKGKDEAQKLWLYASKHEPLFYVYDVEEARNSRVAVEAWVSEMRRLGGEDIRLGVYLGKSVYDRLGFDTLRRKFDFVWYARYGRNDGKIPGEKYRPHYPCDLWQYTSEGRCPGISGGVDLSVCMDKDLEWFLGKEVDAE